MYFLNEIEISSLNKNQLVQFLTNSIKNDSSNHLIVTFNLDFLRISTLNKEFKGLCKHAKIVLPDGSGITSLIKLKYNKQIKRITGNDLLELILHLSHANKFNVAFLGSTDSSLKKMINKMNALYPNINIVYYASPIKNFEYNNEENNKIILELKESEPEILFVALGCPRQEIWLNKHKKIIGAKINIGVGAAFDFYAETRRRSPKLLQKIGLEWLWRLLSEPQRLFKRYIIQGIPFYIVNIIQILKWKRASNHNKDKL